METIAFSIALLALFIAIIGTFINLRLTLKRRYKTTAAVNEPSVAPTAADTSKTPAKLSTLAAVKNSAVTEFENELQRAERIDPSSTDFTSILRSHELIIKNAESIDDVLDEFTDFQHSMSALAIPRSPLTNTANAIIDKWQKITDNIDFDAIDKEAKKG